ncbi:FG-GAP-like repeat-containing protein, partial [Flavobacteriaceae bacterium]|nr:FG-GAP-like repeat-containing protein [Flavobacteriaceae bacterium]
MKINNLINSRRFFILFFLTFYFQLHSQGTVYELGDTGPAGGVIFYDKGDWIDDWRYLEVWTTDESDRNYGCHFEHATTDAIGGGYLNSKEMSDYCNDYNKSFYMVAHGGKRGWHIPNKDESDELYDFKLNYSSIINLNLQSSWYWTSSDKRDVYAYARQINYGDGTTRVEGMQYSHSVRLIRQVTVDDVQERINKSLHLDGNTFYTISPTDVYQAISENYYRSIGFWIYPEESGDIMAMYENFDSTNSDFLIRYNGTTNKLEFLGDGTSANGNYFASFGDLPENQWHHVYMVVNNGSADYDDYSGADIGTLYAWVNGVRQTFSENSSNKIGVSVSNNTSYLPIYVGGFENAVSSFEGYIDDLAIWGQIGTVRGMSTSEVNSIYSIPPIENQNRLNTGFDFNSNDSTTINDISYFDYNLVGSQSFTLNSEVPYNYDYKPLNLGFDYSGFVYNEFIQLSVGESLLVGSINVFDPNSDSSEITFSLDDSWGGDVDDFNLVGNNLYFNESPENVAFAIKVIATDAQSNSFEKILQINVIEAPFTLDTKSPIAFSNNVALDSNITLAFASSTKSSTITSSNIVVNGSSSGLISGSFSGGGTSTIVFDPTNDFMHGEVITVTLTSSVQDSSNNSLNNPQSFSFRTKSNLSTFIPSFNASEITNTADNVQSVFVADLDGDGDNDLISASYDDNTIAWHENDGSSDPVFTSSDISTNAVGAWSVFAADMDNDGDMDIISASYGDDTISWYENDGASNPSFTTRQITNIADGVWSIFAADIDSDGDMDLISASRFDDTIAWYENDGLADPLFTRIEIDFTNMDAPTSVYAADMDGDGDTDIVSASRTDDKIVWFENDGAFDPTFSLTVIATSADNPRNIYLADMDNDGDMDIVSASANDDTIAWYENNGASDPTFTASDIATDADLVNGVFVADLNNDGFLDIVSASENDNTIAWYENDGNANPTFTATDITTSVNGARSIFAADLDGDGDTDLISGSTLDDTVFWHENLGGNNAPVATAQTDVAAEEQAVVTITLAGTDTNSDPLTYIISSLPTNGTLSDNGTVITADDLPKPLSSADVAYVSSSDSATSDSFTFKVNDGSEDSEAATIGIAIATVNDPPVATPQTDVAATEQNAVTITLAGLDPDLTTPVIFKIISLPSNGTLSDDGTVITADDLPLTLTNASGEVDYVSTSDSETTDSFTFKVNDGTVDSEAATVSLAIAAVNDIPVATPQTDVAATEQTEFTITLAGTDPDGTIPVIFKIISLPSDGTLSDDGTVITADDLPLTLSNASAEVTYISTSDTAASDSFTFKVNDGTVDSEAATIGIAIATVNDVPVASAQTDVAATEQTALTLTLAGTDLDNDTLSYVIQTLPTIGTLSDNGTVITADDLPKTTTSTDLIYVSTSDTATSDSFTFIVNDGTVDSEAATISLAITAVNDVPVATAQTDVAATEQTEVTITLAGTDAESDAITFIVSTLPTNGTLSDNGTVITADDLPKTTTSSDVVYVSTSDIAASDSFTFKVNDGSEDSEAATIGIAIATVNDEPTKVNLSSLTIDENAAATEIGTLSTDDLDTNDTFTYELVSGEGDTDNSLFTIDTDKLKNTDAFDFETKSSYSIRIKSTDSGSASIEGVFAITVNNINDISISSEVTSTYCDGSDGIGAITIVTSETNGEVTYTWTGPNGFSSTNQNLTGLESGTYELTVKDDSFEKSIELVVEKTEIFNNLSICYVTSDSEDFTKNRIFLSYQDIYNDKKYEILREGSSAGVYEKIGELDSGENSFLDTSSNSSSSSYSYKVRLLDNCDVVSTESSGHRTILLQSSLAVDNSVNLNWNSYEGVNYSTYKIYRRVNNGDFEELTAISSTNNSYNDTEADVTQNAYAYYVSIAVESCTTTQKTAVKENVSNNFRYTSRVNETTEIKSNQKFIQDDNGDYDNDGVLNAVDSCLDTPEGSIVDVNGCAIFTLPLDNNKVSVISASCIGTTDGSIGLSVEDASYAYSVTVTGQDDPITLGGETKTTSVTGL